jgi:uncharacterized repeat protein (TIGR03806 family)
VPTNVVATAPGPTQVQLNWTASTDTGGSGLAGYRVYRNGSATPIASPTTNSYTDNSVVASTAYSYTVRAFDAATPPNESALSAAANVTTPATPPPPDTTAPSVPTNVVATAPGPTQVQLNWTASTDTGGSGLAGYRVYRNGSATPLASPTTNSYTDNTVVASTAYSYTVRAFDAATPPNESALSSAANVTTPATPPPPDTTPPSVPANVVATAPGPTQVQLNWTASTDTGGSGLAGYRVYRNGGATPIASPATNSYTDNSVVASTAYSYTVRAFDAATPPNESALSAAANVTTPNAPPTTPGLETRPTNASCVAGDQPTTGLTLARVFPNLSFSLPVQMLQAPGSGARWFVVEKGGVIRTFQNTPNVASSSVFLDITDRVLDDSTERGLLGMAFHPDFPTDDRVFIFYIGSGPTETRISVFRTNDGGATLDPNSEVKLLTAARTQSNHNGGNIMFGPDGLLYFGTGDGGGSNDQHGSIGNGQNLQTVLGKMLRIDVGGESATTYTIPAGNPFAATGGSCTTGTTTSAQCREIYAYGFRNPWRWSFDRDTDELWVGDVGQGALEEIDRVVVGGNYGWRCREGTQVTTNDCAGLTGPFLPPVAEYGRSAGFSVTGGYVYRGTQIPALVGRYVFADYGTGRIWDIPSTSTPTVTVTSSDGFDTSLGIASFGEDVNGELYVVDLNGGGLHQLVAGAAGGGSVPTLLSASGCGAPGNPALPASGLVPYAPNAGFWSDGLVKERWLALPNGTTINPGSGDWDLPNGSVLRKDFRFGTRLVETRLFMRHTNGNWAGYTYEWNAGGTDATRVAGGKTVDLGSQDWIFPSEAQCLQCHTNAAGRTLGLETAQLNGLHLYPLTGRTANQIVTLDHISMLNPGIPDDPATLPAMPNPYGASGTVTERARAWLHTNCSFCHRPGGPAPSNMDLRYTTALAATNACNATPQNGNAGLPAGARIIAPGMPGNSVLFARIDTRAPGTMMPPLASLLVDDEGVQVIQAWITGLTNCN